MKIRDILKKPEFEKLKAETDEFVEIIQKQFKDVSYDNSYFESTEPKEIFDAVWGPVEFNKAEIILLDTPLLQRLRKIKQLGLASYVYCGADYSRFSHTIGVFYLANEMSQIIDKKPKAEYDYNMSQIVRLAAIFHDVGHMYFSHVSEYFFTENIMFSRYEELKRAYLLFCGALEKKVALHEMLSVMIVNSPYVGNLLEKLIPYMDDMGTITKKRREKIIEYISCLIVGIANDKYILPYSKIINGSVDADKCDYLSRDSHTTNVPVGVDIFRLIHKMSVEESTGSDQEHSIWVDDGETSVYFKPVIKSSALEALNQLLMSRNIMFKSVYYHQKVRTAEVFMRNVLESLDKLGVSRVSNFTDILLTTDDFFSKECYDSLKREGDQEYNKEIEKVINRMNRLNCRILMKRTCSITIENLSGSNINKHKFTEDFLLTDNPKTTHIIENAVKREYNKLCKLLERHDKKSCEFMFVEYPRFMQDSSKLDTVISYGHGQLRRASEIFQMDTWMGSKESRNSEHYLVSDCLYRDLAFLALQKILYQKYCIVLKVSAATYSKIPLTEIAETQRELVSINYYKDCLVIVSDLILVKYKKDIDLIVDKFKSYEGKKGANLSVDNTKFFLTQFLRYSVSEEEIYLLLEGVINLLKSTLFINRKEFNDSLEKLLNQLNDCEDIVICPLGNEKDSGCHLAYYFNDLQEKKIEIVNSLDVLLKREDLKDVIMFDDGAYSGKQVVSIFQEYMGHEKTETNEKHVESLSEENREKLKQKRIIIIYICFNEKNEKYIKNELKEIGLENIEIYWSRNMSEKAFSSTSALSQNGQTKELVQKVLQDIGYNILKSSKVEEDGRQKSNWSERRLQESALGYNDSQQMVVLKSSVPTYTITAFWVEDGMYKGEQWVPLFYRTLKRYE